MSFLRALNISGSALTAQRMRLDAISENISNIDTTRTEKGGPYKRKVVQFQAVGERSFKSALGNAVMRESERHVNHIYLRHRLAPQTGKGDAGVVVSNIFEDDMPFKTIYDPTHPDADEYGYVQMPNVELVKEVVDAMSASRSYEANVTAVNAIKLMASKALEVGR
ncbi:MAG: flagellar basal body rod protein FlgC [Clostridiales bacterium]|nr:flagellar basal body rod protein FlgC [Clostridiales bacterium]